MQCEAEEQEMCDEMLAAYMDCMVVNGSPVGLDLVQFRGLDGMRTVIQAN